MKPVPTRVARKPGRPLSFDREAALDAAMRLFWEQGFEATSVAELTQAMGVAPPSLYAAFGDKRGLFRETVDRYLGGLEPILESIRNAATAREAAHRLLIAAAVGDTGENTPPGCLLASSIVSSSAGAAEVREEIAAIRREIETTLRERIAHDITNGQLSASTDAEATAGHVFAVIQGMSTLAKDGAGRDKLLRIAETAMRCW